MTNKIRAHSGLLDRAYRAGFNHPANHHRWLTVFSLHCDGVSPDVLLQAVFDAFRPGDTEHPGSLATWWANGSMTVRGLQLWASGTRNREGIYSWHGSEAKRLVHYYELPTSFGQVRFAGAVEAVTDPDAASANEFVSVVQMGDPQDPALYGPGGNVPAVAYGLDTVVEGRQTWRFSVDGDRVRVEHVSEGRRCARDATLYAVFGPLVDWTFKLVHDWEMRRGVRSLPDFLTGKGDYEQIGSLVSSNDLRCCKVTLEFEKPRTLAWFDWLAHWLSRLAR